jgi:uncharacterized oligopeptide transporter (OPT) family protein
MLCGVSGLAFAIGVYLPLASMAPIFVGGLVRAAAGRSAARRPGESARPASGILAASGVVAGEGLAGVLVAGLVASGVIAKSGEPLLGGWSGDLLALLAILGVCLFLGRAARA